MDRLILFLDFDGTLTPIVPRPSQAKLSRSVRETLRKLARRMPVVVISGRAPKDLRRRVGLKEVCYVGHHGLSCLEAGRNVLATMAGRLRRNRIKIMNGDRVSLELSPYDLTRGRITYRHK